MSIRSGKGFAAVAWSATRLYASRPVYWVGFFVLPLFMFLFLGTIMDSGLPQRVPAAMVDMDGTATSRRMTRDIGAMQMVDLQYSATSYSDGRRLMHEGDVFGYFVIPPHFEEDFMAGRGPEVTFYTNMAYYVPANLLYKTFKTGATYQKAGMLIRVAEATGLSADELKGKISPISVVSRPLGNPWLNYPMYLCNSFIPASLQLMVMLMTVLALGNCVKYGRSRRMLAMGDGSIVRTLAGILLPQTLVWWVMALFMQSWLFGWLGFPMHGSWLWITLSNMMFVLACQGFAMFIFGAIPNLRLAISSCSLLGILTFSVAAFSFPVESMYPAVGIFSWILPMRYQFLIYMDQALNGLDIYWSRIWFVAYIVFMLLPLTLLWRIKMAYRQPVYVP